MLVPASPDDSSIENSSVSTPALSSLALLGEFVLDVPRPNHKQRRLHARRIEEESGTSSGPMTAVGRATGRRACGPRPKVNRPSGIATSTNIGVALWLLALEAHDDLVEAAEQIFLVALLGLDRLGGDQSRLFESLHV